MTRDPLTPIPGLGTGERPKLETVDDIRRQMSMTPLPEGLTPSKTIELGPCGMGMPVLRSRWALDEMEPDAILKAVSGHATMRRHP